MLFLYISWIVMFLGYTNKMRSNSPKLITVYYFPNFLENQLNSNRHPLCKVREFQVRLVKSTCFISFFTVNKASNNNKKRLMITHVTNKVIIKLKWRKLNNLSKPSKENKKYIKLNQVFSYCTLNKNKIKGFLKLRVKAKRPKWNWNIRDSFMARCCYNFKFLEESL